MIIRLVTVIVCVLLIPVGIQLTQSFIHFIKRLCAHIRQVGFKRVALDFLLGVLVFNAFLIVSFAAAYTTTRDVSASAETIWILELIIMTASIRLAVPIETK